MNLWEHYIFFVMFFLIVNSSGEYNRVALMWNTNPAVDAPIKSKTGEKHESK